MINRYKVSKADYDKAKLYLNGKSFKKDTPSWAVKFKEDISFRNGKLYYKELPVIPTEDVDSYLRGQVFDKQSDLPLSRDGAFHLIKQRVAGITRARLMRFLKAQSVVESTKNAQPKPKQMSGKPLKNFHFEADLVFVRKPDLVEISDKFNKTVKKHETYIVSTCEKLTGLCRLGYVSTKEQRIVTPIVIAHIKSIAQQLGIDPKKYKGSSDKGGEFSKAKLSRVTKGWDFVKLGSSVEKKNQTIQSRLFQLARARRGYEVKDLLKQVEKIENQNYSSIQRMTPNEAAAQVEPKLVSSYNKKRKRYIPGNKTNFKVGDYVRVLLLYYGKDKGIGYKSYKNKTYSKRVYKISRATKKSIPPKLYVNGSWMLGDRLSLSQPLDKDSEKIIDKREQQARAMERLEEKQQELKEIMEKPKPRRGRPRLRNRKNIVKPEKYR